MYKFKNIHLDDESMWPKEPRIPLEESFDDSRGHIQPLVNFPMKNLMPSINLFADRIP